MSAIIATIQRGFIIDASVAIRAFIEEEQSTEANALLALVQEPDVEFHVPELFFIEMTNILWKYVLRDRLTTDDAKANVNALPQLRLITHPMPTLLGSAFDLALAYGISTYDASYVALASQLKLPLVTADHRLAQKLADTPYAPILLGDLSF